MIPLASSAARRLSMPAVILGKWKRKRGCSVLGQLSARVNRISKRVVQHFSSVDIFFIELDDGKDYTRPLTQLNDNIGCPTQVQQLGF
jgi:hypothetical protein